MAYNDSDDSVTLEVQSRLDDIFGDLDEPDEESPGESSGDPVEDPLMDLKSLLLSVEWEITDDIMTELVTKIDTLKDRYKEDRILLLFLQLLRSLSNYIKSHKGGSHPQAFQILTSVFKSLESVTASLDMTESEKKRNLLIELKKFKNLKEQIALRRTGGRAEKRAEPINKEVEKAVPPAPAKPAAPPPPKPVEPVEPVEVRQEEFTDIQSPPAPPRDPVLESLEEIKRIIRSEFKALRKELALLKKGG